MACRALCLRSLRGRHGRACPASLQDSGLGVDTAFTLHGRKERGGCSKAARGRAQGHCKQEATSPEEPEPPTRMWAPAVRPKCPGTSAPRCQGTARHFVTGSRTGRRENRRLCSCSMEDNLPQPTPGSCRGTLSQETLVLRCPCHGRVLLDSAHTGQVTGRVGGQ